MLKRSRTVFTCTLLFLMLLISHPLVCIAEDPDVTAPQISGVQLVESTENEAVIGFLTDEPGTTIIQYGLTSSQWGSYEYTQSDDELVTDHRITISVDPPKEYFLRVGSVDAAGNDHSVDPLDSNPSDEYVVYFDGSPPSGFGDPNAGGTVSESDGDRPEDAASATCFIDALATD